MNKPVYFPCFMFDDVDFSIVEPDSWMTDDLKEEISGHYPDSVDIKDDRERCKVSFETHAKELFPSGRQFASFVQLGLAVDMFQTAWGASTSHGSSHFTCFMVNPPRNPEPQLWSLINNEFGLPPSKKSYVPLKFSLFFSGSSGK
jgi:hypothetical protein